MTQLQVEFNKLREQQRANLVNEELKARETTTKEREASVKEQQLALNAIETDLKSMKAPVEIQEMFTNSVRNEAQAANLQAGIEKIKAEVDNIKMDTRLTDREVKSAEIKLTNQIMDLIHRTTGVTFPGDAVDTIYDWIGGILGSGGKAIVGKLIG